jgi:hypothetical protein
MTDNLSERDIFDAAGPGGAEPSQTRDPSPRDTVPADQEQPTANLGQIPSADEGDDAQAQPDGQQASPQEPQRRGMLDDLREERKRRQEFERQLAEAHRERAEMRGAMAQMQQFVQQSRQVPQAPQAPQQPQEIPDPFVDPQGFAEFQARQVFDKQFQPFAQQFQQREQMLAKQLQGLQRATAQAQYGADEAKAAEEAFNTAAARNSIHPLEHQRIQQSDNPYAAAVEWHRRERTLSTTGGDPDKWFENEFQRRLREDPAFQQQTFSLLNGQAQQAAGTPVSAAGRPAPVFAGLPSLNAAPGTSGQAAAPINEADIFNAAPPKMGGRR